MLTLLALDKLLKLAHEKLVYDRWVCLFVVVPECARLWAGHWEAFVDFVLGPRVQFVLQLRQHVDQQLVRVMLQLGWEFVLDEVVEECGLEVVVLVLEGEHLLHELGHALAQRLLLKERRVLDLNELLVEEVTAEFTNTNKQLYNWVHIASILRIIKTNNSKFSINID